MKTHVFSMAILFVLAAAASAAASENPKQEPISPGGEVIRLFNGKDLTGLYTWLKGPGRNNDPQKAFTVRDGAIRVSGEGRGYVATERTYRDYHLIVEYKWGQRTDGSG
jgi:hypothetical protein